MKHPRDTHSIVAEALRAAGLALPDSAVDALTMHLDAVLAANVVHNLTAITDASEAAELHIVDSLTALPELEAAPPGPVADLGSGAGYPGVPLAVASGRRVTLVESVGKKARFLREMTGLLAPYCNLAVEQTRAELLAFEAPAVYSAVTARAVSSLASLVELASPLLTAHGVLIALKGEVTEDELERGVAAGHKVGMELVGRRDTRLPSGGRRALVVFERSAEVPETRVPRRPGRAQRKPLA